VVRIADGDTFTLLVDREQLCIRLAEIDTPEKRQPYGNRARQALSALIYGKTVRVVEIDRDRYGRVVGRVYAGGIDINAEMVRRGAAWVYRKYAKDPSLYELENEARAARRGVWALPEAEREPPWTWREDRRKGHSFSTTAPAVRQGPVIGNRRSSIYHLRIPGRRARGRGPRSTSHWRHGELCEFLIPQPLQAVGDQPVFWPHRHELALRQLRLLSGALQLGVVKAVDLGLARAHLFEHLEGDFERSRSQCFQDDATDRIVQTGSRNALAGRLSALNAALLAEVVREDAIGGARGPHARISLLREWWEQWELLGA
jgi:hypothetical protein